MLQEALAMLAGCLDALSPKQRVALLLKHGAGLSIKEIARILRETDQTVQHSILPLALEKLETRLQKRWAVSEINAKAVQRLLERFIESKEPLGGKCPPRSELIRYLSGGDAADKTFMLDHIALCRLCWVTVAGLAG